MRFLFFIISIHLILSCSTNQSNVKNLHHTNELPNVVLIIGDDQGYPYFGFMGANYVYTPNMDALAKSGTVFTQGYVPSNHCRPSLQTLMTGTLPIDYNIEVDAKLKDILSRSRFASEADQKAFEQNFRFHAMKEFETLPKLLAKKGYVSFQGGKWWEFNYENGGFSHGMTTGWSEKDRKNGSKWFKQFMGGTGLELARATMQPVYDFIDQFKDRPMFIWYAPELPHYPFDAPDQYYDLYKDKNMTESAKRYYANCSWFDDGVGELQRYLKEKGEFDNTLFVYVNDNGWEQNPDQEFRHDSLRWHNGGDKGKLSMYDQSFRTPIIFSWVDKIRAGITKDELIHSADIPATILDFIGVTTPENYFGQSYVSVIEGKSTNSREAIIGNITQVRSEEDMMGKKLEGYWVRTPKWFMNWNMNNGEKALFDMTVDAQNNFNIQLENLEVVDQLTSEISIWKSERAK